MCNRLPLQLNCANGGVDSRMPLRNTTLGYFPFTSGSPNVMACAVEAMLQATATTRARANWLVFMALPPEGMRGLVDERSSMLAPIVTRRQSAHDLPGHAPTEPPRYGKGLRSWGGSRRTVQ